MIIQGSPEILRGPQGLNGFGDFGAPDDAVKALFLAVTGREADPTGLKYFTDRFGTSIEPGEAIIFQNMALAEIQARNAFLAQQSAAAQATALAEIEAKQNQGKTYFYQTDVQSEVINTVYHGDGSYTQYYKDGSYETFGLPRATGLEDIEKAVAEQATKKAIADAYAAAQAAAAKAAAATTLAAKQAADALRVRALVAVKALYLQVLGREGDQAGLDYFADRFGDVIDPDELQVFSDMSKPEIDARNAYLADMAKKSKEDAAKAKAIADQFAATAAKAKADAAAAAGGVSPMLILAAAAAAYFIGG